MSASYNRLMRISKKRGDISTREKILDAASTLFAENGYDGTSVEQIANIVGIKAPSLYRHYMGKEDMAAPVGVDYLYAVRE